MRCLKLVIVLVAWWTGALAIAAEPKTVLLIGQSHDNHPATTHEYMPGLERLAKLLEPTPGLKVRLVKADEPWTEGPELLAEADGAVLFLAEGARWCLAESRRHAALIKLAARGGGLVALHWAIGTRAPEPIGPFLALLGGCHGGPDRKYQVVETDLRVVDPSHPIAKGIKDFHARDEYYYQLKFVAPADRVQPILQAMIDGQPQTVAWAFERPDGGRSFGFSGLHFDDNWNLPEYGALVSQAVLWTLKLPE